MNALQRYILSGGPSSGKTLVAQKLKEKGFTVIEEQARLVIKEQMQLGTEYVPWKDIQTFSRLVFEHFEKEFDAVQNHNDVVFSDRGPFDIFGYLLVNKQPWDLELLNKAQQLAFTTKVFFFPPWKEIYQQDEERIESFEEGIQIANALRQVYLRFGFQLIEMPYGSVEERIEFIFNEIA